MALFPLKIQKKFLLVEDSVSKYTKAKIRRMYGLDKDIWTILVLATKYTKLTE